MTLTDSKPHPSLREDNDLSGQDDEETLIGTKKQEESPVKLQHSSKAGGATEMTRLKNSTDNKKMDHQMLDGRSPQRDEEKTQQQLFASGTSHMKESLYASIKQDAISSDPQPTTTNKFFNTEPELHFQDGVALMGSDPNRALCVVLPPDKGERQAELEMIREINDMFSREAMRNNMKESSRKDQSVREIQSERFEIFIRDAADKGSSFWDSVLSQKQQSSQTTHLTDCCTDRIIAYAEEQARRDPRIRDAAHDFKFGNYSMIASYGSVPAQAPHVDLLQPNFQFILILTDGSPSTNVYDLADNDRISTVNDLQRIWQNEKMEHFHDNTFPPNLARVLENSDDCQNYLRNFGDVLHSNAFFKKVEKRKENVPAGTVLSLPGGVVHAGPASKSFRAVLFFSAVPITETGPLTVEYNPDTQFSNVLLAGFFTQVVWRSIGMTRDERLYLLRRLATYIRQADVRTGWDRHFFDNKNLQKVVYNMTTKLGYRKLDAYLTRMAAKEDLVFYHLEMIDFKGDFKLVSDDRLHTKWIDGSTYQVVIFKRAGDNRALLQYPTEKVEKIGDGWEGHQPGKHYRLQMHPRHEDTIFNGKNGTLWDDEGNEIKCFVLSEKKRKRGSSNVVSADTSGV